MKSSTFTIAIYYRLFFPLLVLSKIEKILYIDVDTIVLGNLKSLYFTNISPYPVAAVRDNGMYHNEDSILLKQIGIERGCYFNSGVLLINLEYWKNAKVSERCMQYLFENSESLKFMDQDALNVILKNNWFRLETQYNFCHPDISIDLPKKEVLKKPITILHFTGSKPWHFTNNARLRHYYYRFLDKSPVINKKRYVDFKWDRTLIANFLKIRLIEFYIDNPIIKNIWQKLK